MGLIEKGKAPKRSLVFAAVTAEEMGLLGSRAYVASARAAGTRIVANLNSDMFLPLYPLKRLVVFGLEESDLSDDARAVAAELGIEVQSDPQPQRNRFIRPVKATVHARHLLGSRAQFAQRGG